MPHLERARCIKSTPTDSQRHSERANGSLEVAVQDVRGRPQSRSRLLSFVIRGKEHSHVIKLYSKNFRIWKKLRKN